MSSLYFSATKNLFSFKLGPNSPPSTENSLDVQTPNPSIVKSILFLLATYRLPRAARFLFDPGGKNARERILREASSTKKGVFFTVLNSQRGLLIHGSLCESIHQCPQHIPSNQSTLLVSDLLSNQIYGN